MFESDSSKRRDFSKFDSMSTEMLENILRQDYLLPEEESDTDAILYISEVLAKRASQDDNAATVEAAWKSFNKNYRYTTGSLFDDDEDITEAEENTGKSTSTELPTKPRRFSAFRMLSVAAILVLVIILGTITSYAKGYDLFGAIKTWTQDVFGYSFSETDSVIEMIKYPEALNDLVGAFAQYDMPTTILLPRYLPDGFENRNTQITELYNCVDFFCWLSDGESDIILQYRLHYGKGFTKQTEKNDGEPEIYESGGIQYSIFENMGSFIAVWTHELIECSISQVNTREELIKILDSIGD